MKVIRYLMMVSAMFALLWSGCDDAAETEADRIGVGAECTDDDDCLKPDTDAGPYQICLAQFKGGYCGIENCTGNDDCPDGSVCVAHTDGVNYCFRRCVNKSECNINRSSDVESNCSANIVFVQANTTGKACVPPSSGD